MKMIIILIMMVLMSTMVMAVSRSISGTTITYTAASSAFSGSLTKGYWAVEDTISGCTLTAVSTNSPCGTNCEYSIISNVIRLVAFPPNEGGNVIGAQKSITLSGSGTGCTLNGNYVESPGTAGALTSIGQGTISISTCDTTADTDCNNCVSFSEISAYASKWILKQGPSFSDVSGAAARWILRNKATC